MRLPRHRPSAMTTLNVSLPSSMRDFIGRECERSGYSTASEYVRALIRAAQLGRLDVARTLPGGEPTREPTPDGVAAGPRRRA